MERPMHIGRLSAKLTPGVFVIEDLMIEGLSPQDRPFLKAKKIEVRVPWWTVFTRKLLIESVALTDWDMVVESWPGGRHSFPKVTPKNPRKGPSRFTTTLKLVSATQRPVHLRRSRHALEHRGAQPDDAALSQRSDEELPRQRQDHERHREDPVLRVISHGYGRGVQP